METDTTAEASKRQKMLEGHNNEDRITQLPDNVLHYILSFLPTKYAVASCVLSTRWKYLWTSIHNFDFCDGQLFTDSKSKNYSKRKTLFRDFVDRVLLLTDVSNINKFTLTCRVCDATHFKKWINIVTMRKVEELVISITHNNPASMFLNWSFSSESLRILKLHLSDYIKIPASISLLGLKILHLQYIKFSSDQEVQEVSLSFPILEELAIVSCKWLKIKTVHIDVPTLRYLRIDDRYLNGELHDCNIKIDAQRLISMKFRGEFLYKYSLCRLSSLVDVSIDISCRSEIDRVRSFLREIYNVSDLELTASSTETLANPAVSADVLSLSRLAHLRIVWGGYGCGKALINLLCITPKIESLIFASGVGSFTFSGYGRIVGTTPQSFLSHLKLVDIDFFNGIQREIWFVKFLIRSVRVIDDLTIKLGRCYGNSTRWKESITGQLKTSTKYQNCILEFY